MNVHQTFTSEQSYCLSQNVFPCPPLTANSITCQHRTKSWGASPTLMSHHAGNWHHCPVGAQTLAKCSLKSPIDRILSVVLLGDEPGWSVAEAVPTAPPDPPIFVCRPHFPWKEEAHQAPHPPPSFPWCFFQPQAVPGKGASNFLSKPANTEVPNARG